MSAERLQKILAQAGIASRRKAEEMIREGQVTINGRVAQIGDKADFTVDHIKVNGTLLRALEDHFYVLFNKPKGVISMMADPEGRPTIADFLTRLKVHVNPIGRLDFNSEGLILLTNDGALAERIQKSDLFPRVYHVKLKGHITTEMIERLQRGARIGNKFVKPNSVRIHEELNKKTKIEIVFLNAANVDVKNYFEMKGFLIEKITRTGIGHLTLHGLEAGKYRIVPKTKFEALVERPDLGVKAIELRHEKEREILPRDQRLRNVDEFGRIIPKTADAESSAESSSKISIKPGRSANAGKASKSAGRSFGGARDKDQIVVRAGRSSEEGKPRSKRTYSSDSIDMPKFKKRSSFDRPSGGATRFGGRSRDGESRRGRSFESRGPRSDGGYKPRSEGGFKPRSGGGFKPRGGKPRFSEGRGGGGSRGGSRGGPIARVKRRER